MELSYLVGEGDEGRAFQLRPGDRLQVRLPGNPSTGFNWSVQAIDPRVLALVQGPGFVSEAPHRMGAPGTVTLGFKALAPGRTHLTLAYKRSWEDVAALRTFELDIVVLD
jgi:inhibitor of cysteine peptidase